MGMESIKTKIIILTTLILGVAIGLTAWHHLKTQRAIISQITSQHSQILGESVRSSIIASMVNGQGAEVLPLLQRLAREPNIKSARIFDDTGRILLSSAAEEIGDEIAAGQLVSYRSGKTFLSGREQGTDFYGTMLPVFNAPACHGCHGAEKEVLGILDIRFSLNDFQALQSSGRKTTLLSSLGLILVLIATLAVFILLYVETPIRKLIKAMNLVEQGDFENATVQIGSSAEMTLLAGKFNLMVGRLKSLLENTVRHERELAVTQEKLAHHEEISGMAITLEERLKEIEFLNITLEEQIENIEEANYKISDLASDLEEKNTNLAQAVTRLSALYKMGLAVNSTVDLERLFDLLLRKTMEVLDAKVGYILLLDQEAWDLRIGASLGVPETVDRSRRIPLRSGGVSHWVVDNRQPLLIGDIGASKEFNRLSALDFQRETIICAPLMAKGDLIGTLTMANRNDSSPFTPDDLELLSTIAAQASVAIKNARLYEEQQTIYLSTVHALVSAIEASDAYTRGHSERVTRYSLALARHLGFPPESIRRLEQAAILHDIGKIGIATTVLHKAEALTGEDVDTLQQHPTIGVRILDPIVFLRNIREIIGQHHERYDGSGYPLGLQGESILPEARILAVADAFDAMTSDRPYRQALSQPVAVQEIRNFAGTQFDPRAAAALAELWEKGEMGV